MNVPNTLIMKKLLGLLFILINQTSLSGQIRYYDVSSDIIPNPERGLQKYSITASNYSWFEEANNLSVDTLKSWKNSPNRVTVVYRYFMLDAFLENDINLIYLNNIQGDFDNIRTAGLKVIVRFSYSDRQGSRPQQPSKAQILSHISQLSPILNKNKDVIFSIQAGFIGTWGEWYYTNSTEFGTKDDISDEQKENRKDIINAILSTTPIEIPIQVRYVWIKNKLYKYPQLNDTTAYQNTPNARIGFYNDAFLNDWGDNGTYSVSDSCSNPIGTDDYLYLSNETKYLPMTGEINGINGCGKGEEVHRTTGANAIKEMDLTNWTTLNRDFDTTFWEQVIASNHYDEIVKNLGYRFILESSILKSNGKRVDLTLNVKNVGYARAFKHRNVYLVLRNTRTNDTTKYLINTDIRKWGDSISPIKHSFELVLSGSFRLYLWIPDKEESLSSNPDYSIRFANSNMWEEITGFNDLGLNIKF